MGQDSSNAYKPAAETDIHTVVDAVHGIRPWRDHEDPPKHCENDPAFKRHLIHRRCDNPNRNGGGIIGVHPAVRFAFDAKTVPWVDLENFACNLKVQFA